MSQIFQKHPVYYFHNRRKIADLFGDRAGWKIAGEEFMPDQNAWDHAEDYKKARSKRPRTSDGGDTSELQEAESRESD